MGDAVDKGTHTGTMVTTIWMIVKSRRWVLLIGFLMVAVNRFSALILPASTKYLLDNIILKRQGDLLYPLIAVVSAALLVQSVTSYLLAQIMAKSAHKLISEMRLRVQAHMGRLSLTYYDANAVGALVSRVMNDVDGLRNLLGAGLIEFTGSVLTACFALMYLFRVNAILTSVVCFGFIVFAVGLSRAISILHPKYRERPQITAEVIGRLTESIGGIRVVKGYHAEARERQVFFIGTQRLLNNALETLTGASLLKLCTGILIGSITVAVILIGTHQILSGHMTPGSFFSYTMFLGMLVIPIEQIIVLGPQFGEALAGLERTRQVLSERPEDEDPRRVANLPRIIGQVEFDCVGFAYDPEMPVLEDINFRAEPGTVTALVGPSGAGKSTIIGLIAAFYVPTTGRIRVDGVDLSTVRLEGFRTQLGVVLQESFLFDGTIWDNVAFGRPNARQDEVLRACRTAGVDEFAVRFEKKYNTRVGERGVRLSGGQKQRISIARAILAQPRILILDEATSSLDSESEALIQEGLKYLMSGRTTFVIAHRLSTIRRADQILVIETGKIIERGTHEFLYAAHGRYYDLYTKQHGIETNRFLSPGEEESPDQFVTSSGPKAGG